jgi:citrate lyase subunit beta/citryl-CoA lyase
VIAAIRSGGYGSRELIVRVNAIETPWGADDLKAAAAAGPDAILVPKVSRPGDMLSAAKLLKAYGAPAHTRLWAMMETPLAILNARDIASVAADGESRFSCLVLGTNDLLKESRARAVGDRFAIIPWLAARAFGLDVIDGVHNDFKDEAGFKAECEQGRTLGMDGKTLIHPSQVDPCNRIFSPSQEEVSWSRKVIEAFALPEHKGKGVITVEGRMVERLHLVMAERVVAIAEAIAG